MSTMTASYATSDPRYRILILPNDKGSPAGKLADAELIFTQEAGALAGMRLLGFAIWERRNGTGRNLTMPARAYSVNGERRSFALLRPQLEQEAMYTSPAIKELILLAYEMYDKGHTADDATAPDATAATRVPVAVRSAQRQLDAL